MTQCHDFTCGNHGAAGEKFAADRHCRKCYGAARNADLAASLGRPVLFATLAPAARAAAPKAATPNRFRLTRPEKCKHFGLKVIPECACEDHLCNAGKFPSIKHREHCQTCTSYVRKETTPPPFIDTLPPQTRTRVNLPTGHFNGSIATHRGRTLLGSRVQNSIFLSELNNHHQPLWTRQIHLPHAAATNGADDPRLFHRGERLCFGFAGIAGESMNTYRVRQCVATLNDDYTVHRIDAHEYGEQVEKNWGWFDHEAKSLAVYSISPHRALTLASPRETVAHETPNPFPWSGGYLRGGSLPVRVGDEYWVWFHGAEEGREQRVYNVGVYAFSASPPFEITRLSPSPLLWAKPTERRFDGKADVVFPAGAVLKNGRWLVSMGVGDSRVEIAEWDHADVNRLVPAREGPRTHKTH